MSTQFPQYTPAPNTIIGNGAAPGTPVIPGAPMPGGYAPGALKFGFAGEDTYINTKKTETEEQKTGLWAKTKNVGKSIWKYTKRYGLPVTTIAAGGAAIAFGTPLHFLLPGLGSIPALAIQGAGGVLALGGAFWAWRNWKNADKA